MKRVLVLGVGNILLRDEGVGVRVVEMLSERYTLPEDVEVVDGGTAGMELMGIIAGHDHLLVCDAVLADEPPASVVRLVDTEIPTLFQTRFSPHQLGLSDVLATLALTGEIPTSMVLIGVVPVDMGLGVELSPEITAAAERALECVITELRDLGFTLEPKSASLGATV